MRPWRKFSAALPRLTLVTKWLCTQKTMQGFYYTVKASWRGWYVISKRARRFGPSIQALDVLSGSFIFHKSSSHGDQTSGIRDGHTTGGLEGSAGASSRPRGSHLRARRRRGPSEVGALGLVASSKGRRTHLSVSPNLVDHQYTANPPGPCEPPGHEAGVGGSTRPISPSCVGI